MFASTARKLIVLTALGMTAIAGATPALAATSSGIQNPDLSLTLSVSQGTFTTGQRAVATYTVTNTTAVTQTVTVTKTLVVPGQSAPITQVTTLRLQGGQSQANTQSVKIDASYPRGQYELTVAAADANGSSSATVTYTIV
jgi:hypothetical protein